MALNNNIGPYLYADGFKAEKKFEFDRTFSVVISGAYKAGIIGPEINGIVILDDDNRSVVLDQHGKINSGYYGPSEDQKKEFDRILAMEWPEFSAFCRGNPRYRKGSAPDLDSGSGPDVGDALNRAIVGGKPTGKPGRSILLPEMDELNANPEGELRFPHSTRDDIIVFLANHHSHVPMNYNNGGFVVAWDIKVHRNVDTTGRDARAGEVDDKYDEAWNAYVEQEGDTLWNEAASNALSYFTEGDYSTYSRTDHGAYGFSTNGRSGGHLILTKWDGPKPPSGGWASNAMAFTDRSDYIEWLKELGDTDLARFYKFVANVDHDTAEPHKEMAYQYAFLRTCKEDDWNAGAPLPDGIEIEAAESHSL